MTTHVVKNLFIASLSVSLVAAASCCQAQTTLSTTLSDTPAPVDITPVLVLKTTSAAPNPETKEETKSEVISSPEPVAIYSEPPPQDLWDRIRAGYGMTDLDEPMVRQWEQYYVTRPDYLNRIVERGSRYMFYIVTEIERRGMPLEIALLPMIESAFNPIANSSAAAVGIWQFIPSTGKNFGMQQDYWADSRRDIVAATKGALDYLQKLHGMFGDWQLALASYNWGEGAVGRAVARNQAAGLPAGYTDLRNMPRETREYLPKLQAVKNIVSNPGAFNVKLASIPNQPYFKSISIARHIDIKRAIAMAEISAEEFTYLNPAHNRPVIGGRQEHHILLPADKADMFLSRLEDKDQAHVSWMAYKTTANDKLDAIAKRFNTTVESIKGANGIRAAGNNIPAGYHLLVPSNGDSDSALASLQNAIFTKLPDATTAIAGRSHRVRNGENLGFIARKYGTSVAKLKAINHLKTDRLRIGQMLAVSGSGPIKASSGKAGKRKVGKVVKSRGKAKAVAKKRR